MFSEFHVEIILINSIYFFFSVDADPKTKRSLAKTHVDSPVPVLTPRRSRRLSSDSVEYVGTYAATTKRTKLNLNSDNETLTQSPLRRRTRALSITSDEDGDSVMSAASLVTKKLTRARKSIASTPTVISIAEDRDEDLNSSNEISLRNRSVVRSPNTSGSKELQQHDRSVSVTLVDCLKDVSTEIKSEMLEENLVDVKAEPETPTLSVKSGSFSNANTPSKIPVQSIQVSDIIKKIGQDAISQSLEKLDSEDKKSVKSPGEEDSENSEEVVAVVKRSVSLNESSIADSEKSSPKKYRKTPSRVKATNSDIDLSKILKFDEPSTKNLIGSPSKLITSTKLNFDNSSSSDKKSDEANGEISDQGRSEVEMTVNGCDTSHEPEKSIEDILEAMETDQVEKEASICKTPKNQKQMINEKTPAQFVTKKTPTKLSTPVQNSPKLSQYISAMNSPKASPLQSKSNKSTPVKNSNSDVPDSTTISSQTSENLENSSSEIVKKTRGRPRKTLEQDDNSVNSLSETPEVESPMKKTKTPVKSPKISSQPNQTEEMEKPQPDESSSKMTPVKVSVTPAKSPKTSSPSNENAAEKTNVERTSTTPSKWPKIASQSTNVDDSDKPPQHLSEFLQGMNGSKTPSKSPKMLSIKPLKPSDIPLGACKIPSPKISVDSNNVQSSSKSPAIQKSDKTPSKAETRQTPIQDMTMAENTPPLNDQMDISCEVSDMEITLKGKTSSYSFSQSVVRKAGNKIDAFEKEKSPEPIHQDKRKSKKIESESEIETEGDDAEERNSFINFEAEEANGYESGDSMSSSERDYIEENQIADTGVDIGSEDTEESELGEEEASKDSFIVSDPETGDEEIQQEEESEVELETSKRKSSGKKKRIIVPSSSSEEDNADLEEKKTVETIVQEPKSPQKRKSINESAKTLEESKNVDQTLNESGSKKKRKLIETSPSASTKKSKKQKLDETVDDYGIQQMFKTPGKLDKKSKTDSAENLDADEITQSSSKKNKSKDVSDTLNESAKKKTPKKQKDKNQLEESSNLNVSKKKTPKKSETSKMEVDDGVQEGSDDNEWETVDTEDASPISKVKVEIAKLLARCNEYVSQKENEKKKMKALKKQRLEEKKKLKKAEDQLVSDPEPKEPEHPALKKKKRNKAKIKKQKMVGEGKSFIIFDFLVFCG